MSQRFLVGLVCLVSTASALAAAEDRILARPESGRLTVLSNSVHPKARTQADRGQVDPSLRIEFATLLLKPAGGLEAFLASQHDPGSASYHRWLTPEEFGSRFGASDNDVHQLVTWLNERGMTVKDIARGRQWITFSGTAGQIDRAFHTSIHKFLVDGVLHFAGAVQLAIPAEFENAIAGVRGLDDFRPKPLYRLPSSSVIAGYTSGQSHYLVPDDLATIYDIASLYQSGIDGTGQKIAVIGQTDFDVADIRAFRNTYNLPANDPQIMLVGNDPGTTGDVIEADLDLEWAGAIARNATIIFVNSTDVFLSSQYAVDQNVAPVMTLSYGGCEQENPETLRPVAQQANAQGITWMASSGDWGAATCDQSAVTPQASKGYSVAYPSSIPEITSVGGTEFSEAGGSYWASTNNSNGGSALSYIPEMAWNDSALDNGLVSAGGGASVFFTKPWWQVAAGVPADGARDIPDVSLTASANHDGYRLVAQGRNIIVGGTSASSPVFAGMIALLNQSLIVSKKQTQSGLGNINPELYRLAAQQGLFHDITTGDNKVQCQQGSPGCVNGFFGYSAASGYDLATGIGTADLARLAGAWNSGIATVTTLTATPASISPSDQVTLSATVNSAIGTPSGTVTFLANDTNIGTGTINAGAVAVTVDAPAIAVGNGTVSALYSGDATHAPSSGSAKVALAVSATNSYIVPSIFPNPVNESNGSWIFTLTLTQKADLATSITAFTIDGVDFLSLLRKTTFAGTFSSSVTLAARFAAPGPRVFHFAGVDTASGNPWSVDQTFEFLGPLGPSITPGISLTGTPTQVQQNTSADPSCQWTQQLDVQETGGFVVSLSRLTVGGTNLTSSISQIFGTTRLAPYGRLTGSVCVGGLTPTAQQTITLRGSAESGATVTASFVGTYTGPAAFTTTMSATPAAVTFGSQPSTLNLDFGNGTPAWTAVILTSGKSNWLTVSPTSGTGPANLTLQGNPTGLSNGVYNAVISIQSVNTAPQSLQIPVAFILGNNGASIMGANSAASAAQGFAPGMWMAIYGSNLAPSTKLATSLPLPLSLAGASATVNGIAAPLWFVSPGQMNIQIPYETGAGPAVLGINNNGATAAFTFSVSPTAPGIFNTSLTGKPGQTIVAYISGEGDVTPTLATGTIPSSGTKLANFPQPRQPIAISVGGEDSHIAFAGIVSLVGVTQINFTIPSDMTPGTQPVVVTVGGVKSAPVNMTVTAP